MNMPCRRVDSNVSALDGTIKEKVEVGVTILVAFEALTYRVPLCAISADMDIERGDPLVTTPSALQNDSKDTLDIACVNLQPLVVAKKLCAPSLRRVQTSLSTARARIVVVQDG